jgi:CRISPR-associated protein Csm2
MNGGRQNEGIGRFKGELSDLKKLSMERLVEIADAVGAAISRKVKTNQIRRFLDGTRKVEAELKSNLPFEKVKDQIILLRPKLAYAAGRHEDVKELAEILDAAVKSAAQTQENFTKFLRFMESIIAYHRFHGGRD